MPMAKALIRIIEAKPREEGLGGVAVTLYDWEEKEWVERRFRRSERLLLNMINEAARIAYERQPRDGYVFVEIETMGLRVIEGEGDNPGAETVLSPIPSTLHAIELYRATDGEKAEQVERIELHGEHYVYDGKITVEKQAELILLETGNGIRPILAEELYLPKTKTPPATEKKRRKRKRRTAKKTTSSKQAKKTRKSRKKKRGRKTRKRK